MRCDSAISDYTAVALPPNLVAVGRVTEGLPSSSPRGATRLALRPLRRAAVARVRLAAAVTEGSSGCTTGGSGAGAAGGLLLKPGKRMGCFLLEMFEELPGRKREWCSYT